ncbi:ribonuclease HII [Jeotgalibaca sp. A127]|uniref:ribonuclease HII n=1 Tax=Jeotgalibaca sp. A127 TaxID=3457324 RepID=UPI003FD4B3B4
MSNKYSIGEIKTILAEITEPTHPFFSELSTDTRKGVLNELKKWSNQHEKRQNLLEHQATMLLFESQLRADGYQCIAGIDEVGRGPLAGPVVSAAVILPEDMPALSINDSKKLSKKVRNELYDIILDKAQVGIGIVENTEIDSLNIYEATKIAMMAAVANLPESPDALLIDAMKLALPVKQVSLIKGDAKSYSIAAASIVAKVYRDRLMEDYAKEYPHYAFEKNAGYGTKAHLEGLEQYGFTPIHRLSFEPIKTMAKNNLN